MANTGAGESVADEGRAAAHDESLKPHPNGGPPRPATEPDGAERSTENPHTATDPGTGEPNAPR